MNNIMSFYEAKNTAIETGKLDKIRILKLSYAEIIKIFEENITDAHYLMYIKTIPFEALDFIARNSIDDDIKFSIARKYPLLPETYEYLSNQNEDIRGMLSSNKKLPDNIKEKLRNDPSPLVRKFLNAAYPLKDS